MAFQTKSDHIVWSQDYTIKEFLAAYGKKMPQIVKVTQGFHGDYLVDSISTHEILRVEKYSQQKRVIGQDMYGQPLSLPVNFDKLLQVVADDGKLSNASPPCTLKNLLDSIPLPFKVRLPNITPTSPEGQDLGVFRLDSQFEQRHLLVNCVLVDQLETRVRMIPSSLVDVRLAVGKGFNDKSLNWKEFLSELDQVASTLDYNGISGSSDIALYAAGTPGGDDVPYENLVPKKYLSVQTGSLRKESATSLGRFDTDKAGVKGLLRAIKDKVPGRKHSFGGKDFPDGQKSKSSTHYETMNFSRDAEMSSVSCSEQDTVPVDGAVDCGEDTGNSPQPCSGPSVTPEKPPPLERTVRDKPLRVRLEKDLPPEPYTYNVRKRSPAHDFNYPAGKPPCLAPKPGRLNTSTVAELTPPKELLDDDSGKRLSDAPADNGYNVAGSVTQNYSQRNSVSRQVAHGVSVLPTSVNGEISGFAAKSPAARKQPPPSRSEQRSSVRREQPSWVVQEQRPVVAAKPKLSVRPMAPNENEVLKVSVDRIESWQQVPRDLSSLSCEQICQCLELLKLDQSTINIFREKQLNGALLKLLSEENLREFLEKDTGLVLIDREKTINFIKYKWRPT